MFNTRKVRHLNETLRAARERIAALETRNDTLQERCGKLFDENERLARELKRAKEMLYKERKAAQKNA